MKWAYFPVDIKSPQLIKAGTTVMLPDPQFVTAKRMYGDRMFNVTPKIPSWFIRLVFGREHERPASTARIGPCPKCVRFNPLTRRIEYTSEFTVCSMCDGKHSVINA